MSLYDGLDVDVSDGGKKSSETSSAAMQIKFLQSQLLLKKAAVEQSKVKLLKPSSVTKNTSLKPGAQLGGVSTGSTELASKDVPPSESFVKIENEYDPLYPNDYEKVKAIHAAEAASAAALVKANPFQSTFSNTLGVRSQLIAPEYDPDSGSEDAPGLRENSEPSTSRRGAAFPPPSFLSSSTSSGTSGEGGGFAQKVMAKYGFKEGTGLGKDNQGIASALQIEKTGLRLGKIIKEPPPAPSFQAPTFVAPSVLQTVAAPPPPMKSIPVDLLKNQTKVLLLRNMVGPGEVDNDLEPEVKEECKKYGDVVSCVVYELPNRPDDEAVRIFVEFGKVEQAVKAAIDMSGRFFGGRCVKTGFYNYEHFKQFRLSD